MKDNPEPAAPPPTPDQMPRASFDIHNNFCKAPCTIAFINTSTNATTYDWSFGPAGATSTQTNPTYQYTTDGTYTVKLVASNSYGYSTIDRTVYVLKDAPPCGINSAFYITVYITSNDPYLFYVDDKYFGDVDGNSSRLFTVGAGYRTIKVVQKSGYTLYPTERSSTSTFQICKSYSWMPSL